MLVRNNLQKISKLVYALLFPKFCVECNEEGTWLCSKCQKKILKVVTQVCPECGRVSELGKYCKKCQKEKKINGILATCYYKEGPTREIIHNFKYNSVTELSKQLTPLMSQVLKDNKIAIDIVTFAPLHYRRLAERGYNQAELLALGIGEKNKIEVVNCLIKTKKTKRQVVLKGKKRRENLKGVFKLRMKNDAFRHVLRIRGKTILIIDDIATTGATLNECAAVLKANGAKKVWGLVVSRG